MGAGAYAGMGAGVAAAAHGMTIEQYKKKYPQVQIRTFGYGNETVHPRKYEYLLSYPPGGNGAMSAFCILKDEHREMANIGSYRRR